jgi:hypothetical protein
VDLKELLVGVCDNRRREVRDAVDGQRADIHYRVGRKWRCKWCVAGEDAVKLSR